MLEGEQAAIASAWEFQKAAGITSIPVDLEKYLAVANADLRVSDKLKDSEAGQTLQIGDRNIVVVNGSHSTERQRFTILHELAHIRLKLPSKHGQTISVSELVRYNSRPREEILCDIFASECLLPRQFFLPDLRMRKCEFNSIQELSELYGASLAATGSRFVAYNTESCAWILADEKRVRFVSCSPALRNSKFFVKVGTEIPQKSVLGRLVAGVADVAAGRSEIVPANVWVNTECEVEEFSETAVTAAQFSQGLALLVAEDCDTPEGRSSRNDFGEDELLPELDGVLKFPDRKRRK